MRHRLVLRAACGAAFLGTLLLGGAACSARDAAAGDTAVAAAAPDEAFRPLAPGDSAPLFAAVTLEGDSVRVGGPGAQPLTLLNIWATWCASCREELADLDRLQREMGPRGLRVVAVSVDRGGAEKVARFIRAQRASFTVVHDPEARVREAYQAVGVPESYLISPNGKILWRHAGGLHGTPEAARRAVEAALK